MEEVQTTQTSEVKESEVVEQNTAEAVADEQNDVKEVSDSQTQEIKEDEKIDEHKAVMLQIEDVLKSLEPDEVLKYQRELSAETGENLFEGEIGDLFKKYKPTLNREQKVKNVAELIKSNKKTDTATKPIEKDMGLEQELLTAKIKLQLFQNGVSNEYLEDATIVALSKIKDSSELEKCKEIAVRYSGLKSKENAEVPQRDTHTSIPVGERDQDMTEGEKAVAFLKKLNPNGYK